jgi:zinc transport system ATP-binding protein
MSMVESTNPVIQCRDLWFSYNGRAVLEGISFDIPEGDFVAVMGPNGGGKTTLLKLILGLLNPTKGRLTVLQRLPAQASHLIGYVPQQVDASPHFPISVLDTVVMGGLMPGVLPYRPNRKTRSAAMEAMARMKVDHLAQRRIDHLSGGQRRRAFIARALITSPRVLLLDEPTAGLDPEGQNELYTLLEKLNSDTTIIMVSHDLLALSIHVKSVACVNRRMHYHDDAEITPEMLQTMYPNSNCQTCPVELVAHGLPHRVLRSHEEIDDV